MGITLFKEGIYNFKNSRRSGSLLGPITIQVCACIHVIMVFEMFKSKAGDLCNNVKYTRSNVVTSQNDVSVWFFHSLVLLFRWLILAEMFSKCNLQKGNIENVGSVLLLQHSSVCFNDLSGRRVSDLLVMKCSSAVRDILFYSLSPV